MHSMAATPKRKSKMPLPTPEQAVARYGLMDQKVRGFHGYLDDLESALGLYVVGHFVGWKILHLIHSKKTIAKYEAILNIKVTEEFPEYGPDADRTNAFKAIKAVSNFWKVVSGDEKLPLDRDARRSIT